ncbi:MAG: hypD [Bacteroidetes bacterium]|nr:hypD [Bacteroidota bacterium]
MCPAFPGKVIRIDSGTEPLGCPAFGKSCTPDHPLGAPMVSSEGACAAYYQCRKVGVQHELGSVHA